MKFALVVNLSKERAIKYAKKISLFLLDKNAEIAMIEECSQYFKGIHIHYSKILLSFLNTAIWQLQ